MPKPLELKICENCRKNFLRPIPENAKVGLKHCFQCSSLFVLEMPKVSEYAKSANEVDRLVQ